MSASLPADVQKELEKFVATQVAQVPELKDDATDVAEYLVLLINNGRTPEQAYAEISTIFSHSSLTGIIEAAYKALADYRNQQNQQPASAAPQTSTETPPQQQQQQPPQLSQVLPQSSEVSTVQPEPSSPQELIRALPTKPAAYAQRGIQKNGRGGKFMNGPRSFALRNTDALQKALSLSAEAGSDTFVNSRGQIKKKGRCQQFPHCPNRDCDFAHPTKPCFNFLNGHCPNAPGTCSYLHPTEDVELMAELEKTKQQYIEKKNQREIQYAQSATGIVLCKFGVLCTNQQCQYGHPTPANEDAKVITFEWCPANLGCADPTCTRAHSSLSKIKEVKSAVQPKPAQERSLEPCKFGQNCTNRFCKFRHATTKVVCREGSNCTRIDCYFSHPINEDCRFGDGCKNPNCLFKHPNGKPPLAGVITAKSLSWTKTNERQFAVPDHEVLEQAPPQEG